MRRDKSITNTHTRPDPKGRTAPNHGKIIKRFADELAAKNGGKPLSQQAIAKLAGVSQTRLSEWLKGEENASAESLIMMSQVAETIETRLALLEAAGIRLVSLREDIITQELQHLNPVDELSMALIPVVEDLSIDDSGRAVPKFSSEKHLHLRRKKLADRGSAVAWQVRESKLGAPPFPLNAGDWVIIDCSVTDPSELMRGEPRQRRMVALLLPSTPEHFDTNISEREFFEELKRRMKGVSAFTSEQLEQLSRAERSIDPAAYQASEEANEQRMTEILREMNQPAVLFGQLAEQKASGDLARERGASQLWRLVFILGNSMPIALTDWVEGRLPRDVVPATLLRNAQIFGAVIGWIRGAN